jgi:hypothetical protein
MTDESIRTYSTKSAAILGARRALAKEGIKEALSMVHFKLHSGTVVSNGQEYQDVGKWWWTKIDDGGPAPFKTAGQQRLQQAAANAIREKDSTQPDTPQTACSMQNTPLQQNSHSRSTHMTDVQPSGNTKHREGSIVQHGVRRPNDPNGACGVIWAELDRRQHAGSDLSLKALKEHGEAQGWKLGNTTSEFYAWRKFNGITSERKAAAPKAPKAKKAA